MIPFLHALHLKCCPTTYEVQDYKLNRKTHRFEPKRVTEQRLQVEGKNDEFSRWKNRNNK